MGQAKLRGTYEDRKAASIEAVATGTVSKYWQQRMEAQAQIQAKAQQRTKLQELRRQL